MLEKGLTTPINGSNGKCFSNVVTLPAPAGWPEQAAAAREVIAPYQQRFAQLCAARAPLDGQAPALIIWNSPDEGAPERQVQTWRASGQMEVQLR